MRISTVPLSPSTTRTTVGPVPWAAMQSVTRTVPVSVENSLSTTSEPSR